MTTQENDFICSNGPSKFDLMVALFDGKEIYFTLESHGQFRTTVISMQLEDSPTKRNNWVIDGIMYNHQDEGLDFEMSYNCARRKGKVSFVVDGFLEMGIITHEPLPNRFDIPYDA